jgi:hypothetical protein
MNRYKIRLQKWIAVRLTLMILVVLTLSCGEQSMIEPTMRIESARDWQSTIAPTVQIQPTSDRQSITAPTVQIQPTGVGAYELPTVTKTALLAVAGTTFYVSRAGSNGDGRSWATAWNELNQINWGVIQPGDTILIDGGSVACDYPVKVTDSSNTPLPVGCGMEYRTTLTVGANGTADKPITIRLSDEAGRNGTVRIFGGRSTPLLYCGQAGYTPNVPGNRFGINLVNRSYLTIDGRHWAGFMVYGNGEGVEFYYQNPNRHITVRNLEVFDNGVWPDGTPDNPGVSPTGDSLIFERMIVHDNGQDAFQGGYVTPLTNTTWRRVWLFNSRPHPTVANEPFNYCMHSDGIQIYGSLTHQNLLVEDSILGPGLMQGIILGVTGRINNVTVRNSLFVGYHGDYNNAGFYIVDSLQRNGYVFDHVTIVRDAGAEWWSIYAPGSGYQVYDSLFVGAWGINVGSGIKTGNFCWNLNDNSAVCNQRADPQFVDPDYAGVGEGFADFDFTITNPALPQGVGASITSVAQLLGDVTPPTAWISDLPSQSECSNVRLSWDGSDPALGTGVKSFDVQVSDNGGAWIDWLLETRARSAVYAGGADGRTLSFRVRARDQLGNTGSYSAARYTSIIDTISPYEAWMSALPRAQKPPFGVDWGGADACSPVTFDVEYRVGASPTWTRWLTATSDTYAAFEPASPQYGQPYTFRVRARDEVGNSTESNPVSTTLARYTLSGAIVTIRHEPVIWAQVTVTDAVAADSNFGRYIAYVVDGGVYDLLAARAGFETRPPMRVTAVSTDLSGLDFVFPPRDDVIDNGGFEVNGWGSWLTGGTIMPDVISGGHTGNRAARLGGSGGSAWLRHNLSVPEGLVDATLSFLVRLDDAAAGASTLAVELAGTPISHTQVISTTDWTHVWLPADVAAGHATTLTFTVSGSPAVRLDEVSLGSAITGGSQVQLPLVFRPSGPELSRAVHPTAPGS